MKSRNMFLQVWFLVFGIFLTLGMADTQKEGPINLESNQTVIQTDSQAFEKRIIGRAERVRVIPGDIVLEARIDTGATTCSIGVDEYEIFNEDGQDWVEMTLNGKKSKHKLVKYIHIKQHGKAALKRPVIRLRLIIGDISESVKVTIASRENFKYQLLIGRNLLHDRFIVDVSKKYTASPMPYKE